MILVSVMEAPTLDESEPTAAYAEGTVPSQGEGAVATIKTESGTLTTKPVVVNMIVDGEAVKVKDLPNPVNLTMTPPRHNSRTNQSFDRLQCVYFDEENERWSPEGLTMPVFAKKYKARSRTK